MHFQHGQEIVPGYRLERFLGKGQFGEVWSAVGPGRTSLALKIIDLRGKLGWKEFRGIQRVKAIRHAHLMPITALWLVDDQGAVLSDDSLASVPLQSEVAPPANATMVAAPPQPQSGPTERQVQWLIVAMLLADKSLLERLLDCQQRGLPGIPAEECLGYMEEAAKGIDFLNTPQHELGDGPVAIQHCDIKPDNIMLVGGSVLVCDYGVARVLADDTRKHTATAMAGSPAYMAPECIAGQQPSRATDQYSLAITYYQLRTGELPAQGETYLQVLESHTKGQLKFSRLAEAEQRVLHRATAMAPADRFPSASEFVQQLRAAAGLGGNLTRGPRSAVSRHRQRVGAALVALGAIVVLGVLAAIGWPFPWRTKTVGQGDNGQGQNGGQGVVQANGDDTRIVVLVFEPPDVEVRINGVVQDLTREGTLAYPFTEEELVLEVRPRSDDYLVHHESLMLRHVEEGRKRIELQHSASYWIGQARTALGNGDRESACKHWAKAAALDARWSKPTLQTLKASEKGIDRAAFLENSDRLVSIDAGGEIVLWAFDAARQATPTRLGSHGHYVESMAISANRRWLATAGFQNQVYLWDLSAATVGAPAAVVDHTDEAVVVALAPDQTWLAIGDNNAGVKFWRLNTEAPAGAWLTEMAEGQQKVHRDQLRQLVALDARRAVSLCEGGELVVWTIADDGANVEYAKLDRIDAGDAAPRTLMRIAAAGDGEFLTCADFPNVIDRWSAPRAAHLKQIGKTEDVINGLAVSNNGSVAVAGTANGDVWLFDLVGSRAAERLTYHNASVAGLALSPDGNWLVTGGWDGRVALWDLRQPADQRWPLALGRHERVDSQGETVTVRVNMVAISADGRWLISAGDDGSIKIWDLRECDLIRHAIGPDRPIIDA